MKSLWPARVSGRLLKRLKTIENHKAFRSKKWSRSLTGGGRLRGSNCKALTGKVLVFFLDKWSLMGGGRTRKFDCNIIIKTG